MSLFTLRYPLVAAVLLSLFLGMRGQLDDARKLGTLSAFYTGELVEISRLDREVLDFERSVNEFVNGSGTLTKKDIALRFDLLWARVNTTYEKRFFAKIESMKKYEHLIKALSQKLAMIDPIVLGLQPGDTEQLARINEALNPHLPEVSQFTESAYAELVKHSMKLVELQRGAMHGLQKVQLWFLLFASAALLFLVYQLERGKTLVRQLQKREKEISLLATTDHLTGLRNRREFDNCIELAGRNASSGQCNLLLIDLDGFKAVNDTYGHAAGDEVLREVAARLQMAARAEDKLARLGGDEFALLVVGPSEIAVEVASRIVDVMREPFVAAGTAVRLSACVGIANKRGDFGSSKQMALEADLALYYAKENGKNQFYYYSESLMKIAARKTAPSARSTARRVRRFMTAT